MQQLEEAQSRAGPELKRPPASFFVLVSKMDPCSQPVLFFPYPPTVQLERQCPAGYEGKPYDVQALCVRIEMNISLILLAILLATTARCLPLSHASLVLGCCLPYIVHEIPASETDMRVSFAVTKRFMYNAIGNSLRATNMRKTTASGTWSLFWGEHLKAQEFAALLPFQRVNHFPGSFELGRKDRLCGHLLRARKRHPAAYRELLPETYLTANSYDRQQFLARFHAEPRTVWILKPPNLSCGRGIKLVSASSHAAPKLSKKRAYVAQRYVADPFLINGLKFDPRLYVAVTSFDPLRVFLFHDGLVRFCTEKYSSSTSKSALQNPFGHLTNYSVNKKNHEAFHKSQDDAQQNEDHARESSKWSLQMLFKFLREQGKARELETLQNALEDLVVKTLIAVSGELAPAASSGRRNGFELYGFDVLLEGEAMAPRLLEVNVFPSLSSSSPMDKRIKTVLMSDLFQLVGIPFVDARRAAQQLEQAKQDRLHGVKQPNSLLLPKESATRNRRRTLEELRQNPASSFLTTELEGEDLQLIKEMEEELHRQGHFKRIFPTPQAFDQYAELFESLRYRTLLCMRWLQHTNQDGGRWRRPSVAKQDDQKYQS